MDPEPASMKAVRRPRPQSPNIQIYQPQITSVLSIANRITGVALSLGAVWLVFWLYAAAAGPETFGIVHRVISPWGREGLAARLYVRVHPASLRRHPPPRLGHSPRLRTPVDLHNRMDGRPLKLGSHRNRLDRQLVSRNVEKWPVAPCKHLWRRGSARRSPA
jgi:hypothetical protein